MTTPNDAPETVEVDQVQVACDGGGGALGHPKVYLSLAATGTVDCPYCDKRFVLKDGAGHGHGHAAPEAPAAEPVDAPEEPAARPARQDR